MKICSINVGQARWIMVGGKEVMTAIQKAPLFVPSAEVGRLGVKGDEQVDLSVHGGLSKAMYAYPTEHYPFWNALSKEVLPWGTMGENLSLQGLLETEAYVGDELHFSNCILQVTEPRHPCAKFNAIMRDDLASKRMMQSGFCGFYLSVVQAGTLKVGESFTVVAGERTQSIAQMFGRNRE